MENKSSLQFQLLSQLRCKTKGGDEPFQYLWTIRIHKCKRGRSQITRKAKLMILNNLPIFYRDHYFWRHKKAESFDLFSLDKQEIMTRKQNWRSQQLGTMGSLTPSTTQCTTRNRHWRALGSDSSWCTASHVKYTMCNVLSKLLTYGLNVRYVVHFSFSSYQDIPRRRVCWPSQWKCGVTLLRRLQRTLSCSS